MSRAARWARLLLAAAMVATAALAGGCAQERRQTVTVLGPWTETEGAIFEAALKDFERDTGFRADFEGTSALRETLLAQVQADSPPDIAILNSPGELLEYARDRRLLALPESVAKRSPEPWAAALSLDGGPARKYWTPVKMELKSLVWHAEREARPSRWCMGMAGGATSGWPGTDWIEDILLQRAGAGVYEQWATGKLPWNSAPVRDAWQTWGRILTQGNPVPSGSALRTSYIGDGGKGLLFQPAPGNCTREHAGSFVRPLYYGSLHHGSPITFTPSAQAVPELANDRSAYEVAGDMAAMFHDSPAARALLEWLSTAKARERWGGQELDRVLGDPQDPRYARYRCLDASDTMPPTLRNAFHRAALRYLADPRQKVLDPLLETLDQEHGLAAEPDGERVPLKDSGAPAADGRPQLPAICARSAR